MTLGLVVLLVVAIAYCTVAAYSNGYVDQCYRCAPANRQQEVQGAFAELFPGEYQCRGCGCWIEKERPAAVHVNPDGSERVPVTD